jgi:tagatose 1,6-diphosphate aldolase
MTFGKWRRLQQIASPRGTLAILAIDHRGPLRRQLAASASATVLPPSVLAKLKTEIVRGVASATSAVLLDPETGLGPCVASAAMPGNVGLVVALDSGSSGDPADRSTSLVADWSVAKAVRAGAAAVKLLMYYHPKGREASQREALVEAVAQECARCDIPLLLEPLSHGLHRASSPLASAERRSVVIATAKRLVPLGVDVLKAEFPVDVAAQPDEQVWRAACEELTAACPVPWVLLSAGVTFDVYLRQVRVACEAGASGVAAGRAVWKEAVTLDSTARRKFLSQVAHQRMQQLQSLCDALARPFDQIVQPPTAGDHWYTEYEEFERVGL